MPPKQWQPTWIQCSTAPWGPALPHNLDPADPPALADTIYNDLDNVDVIDVASPNPADGSLAIVLNTMMDSDFKPGGFVLDKCRFLRYHE